MQASISVFVDKLAYAFASTIMKYDELIGAAGLLGLNMGYLLHPMWSMLLVALLLFYSTTVYVPLNTNYLLWVPCAFLFGVCTSLFVTSLQEQLRPYFTYNDLLRTPFRSLRVAVAALVLFGASVAWALLPRLWWFWIVPKVITHIAVLMSFWILSPYDSTSCGNNAWDRFVWMGSATVYCATTGLLSTLAPRQYIPLYAIGTLFVITFVAGTFSILKSMVNIYAVQHIRDFDPLGSAQGDADFLRQHANAYALQPQARYE